MKITILEISDVSTASEGWRLSRDLDSQIDWRDIHALDVPVNEFPSALLHFDGFTLLEREMFSTPRNHVMWARTSHVDDPAEFDIPPEFADDHDVAAFAAQCRAIMKRERAAGKPQDEWRAHLPLSAMTAWTQRISYRDLVKFTWYVDYVCNKVDFLLAERLRKVREALVDVISEFTKDRVLSFSAIDGMSKVRFLHEGGIPGFTVGTRDVSSFYVIGLQVPIWLRAQVVRHRPITFVDTLWRDVVTGGRWRDSTIGDEVDVEIAVTRDFWKSVMSKRACWLAQDSLSRGKDAWQAIIEAFGFREEMLPCADGHCPYHKDASLRLTDADPGTPCPRFCNINGIDGRPWIDDMREAAKSRDEYWEREISELEAASKILEATR